MSRHSFLHFALLLLFILPIDTASAQIDSDSEILHLLNRTSFGPTPGALDYVKRIGIDDYIEQQLAPEKMRIPAELGQRLAALPTLSAPSDQLISQYSPAKGTKKRDLPPEEKKAMNREEHTALRELAQAKILMAIADPAQLQEVMVDFWFNHFNVYGEKNFARYLTTSYERDAIRPFALGRFRDLLEATARHPAMLIYLDNWENTDPKSTLAERFGRLIKKQVGINENYARELMELHTLGVNGGYTQTDVTTLAHILTGWGLARGKNPADKSKFYFDAERHDFSPQVFLGQSFPGGGEEEVERALDLLAQHPSTAKHIAYQIAQYFVADSPPQSIVDKLTATFTQTNGDIRAVMRVLLHAPEFWDKQYWQKKFKPPFRYLISSFRVLGIMPPGDTQLIQAALRDMGQIPYRCVTPNGYSNTNDQWLNSDAVLKRVNFAKSLAPFGSGSAAIESAMGANWGINTLTTVRNSTDDMKAALLLGSPEFLYY